MFHVKSKVFKLIDVCVCVHAGVCESMCGYAILCLWVVYARLYVCMCICVYVCMCVRVYVCTCVCVCLFLTYYAYIHMSYAVANELIKLYCGISYYTNWVVSFKYLKVCVVIYGPCPNSILRMCSLLCQHKLCVVYVTCV